MEKSADAFRTISEVAEDLVLPQHVLRFWETRFPQIRPLKRAGGRRYYRPADIVLLRSIRQLLYDQGYTIKGVQRLLKEQTGRGLRNGDALPAPILHAGPQPPLFDDEAGFSNESSPMTISLEPSPIPPTTPDDLREALTLVEECERILAALRRPA